MSGVRVNSFAGMVFVDQLTREMIVLETYLPFQKFHETSFDDDQAHFVAEAEMGMGGMSKIVEADGVGDDEAFGMHPFAADEKS